MKAVESLLVVAITLSLVVTRPRGIDEGVAALLGGALTLILGLVSLPSAVQAEIANWNVYLFFLGMMTIAIVADESGVFDLVASFAAAWSRGSVWRLYLAVIVLDAGVTLLFANDTAALVLTPIVYALVVRLALDPLPFVFATTFMADTASIGLPVSNPLNVIVAGSFGLGLQSYIAHLWLPAAIVVLINTAIFLLIFRRRIAGSFVDTPPPRERSRTTSTLVLLVALAAAYLVASALTFPLGIVSAIGAAVLVLNLRRIGGFEIARLRTDLSWPIFGFIGGMLIVVKSLDSTGITPALGRDLVLAGGTSHFATIAWAVGGSAIGSNVINNLPMALVMTNTIPHLHVTATARLDLVYSTILGADLGPNLTHLGSLATFLWLFFLRRKGMDISTWDYLRIGLLTTPLMLAGATIGLWLSSGR
jgi:arsenical pump membrane protein